MRHARQHEVVAVAASSRQQALILLARDRLADAVLGVATCVHAPSRTLLSNSLRPLFQAARVAATPTLLARPGLVGGRSREDELPLQPRDEPLGIAAIDGVEIAGLEAEFLEAADTVGRGAERKIAAEQDLRRRHE